VSYKNLSFGEYIIAKRKEKELSARQLAIALDISPVYMCDIEKGRKSAVSNEFLENLRRILSLSEEESEIMYDLAAIARNTVSVDLPDYIMANQLVRAALRAAKKNQIPDEKWQRFINEIMLEDENGNDILQEADA
jgi:transcriptional regulator with XRE-family HTH domain